MGPLPRACACTVIKKKAAVTIQPGTYHLSSLPPSPAPFSRFLLRGKSKGQKVGRIYQYWRNKIQTSAELVCADPLALTLEPRHKQEALQSLHSPPALLFSPLC